MEAGEQLLRGGCQDPAQGPGRGSGSRSGSRSGPVHRPGSTGGFLVPGSPSRHGRRLLATTGGRGHGHQLAVMTSPSRAARSSMLTLMLTRREPTPQLSPLIPGQPRPPARSRLAPMACRHQSHLLLDRPPEPAPSVIYILFIDSGAAAMATAWLRNSRGWRG